MSANPNRRRLITLLGASAAAAALPVRAGKTLDTRIFAPAVESAVPLDLVLPSRFVHFAGILDLFSVPSTEADRMLAAESLRRARLMLADEVDPYPAMPPASSGPDA